MKRLLILFTTMIGLALAHKAHAHQAPYSIAYLDVSPDRVHVQLQIPLPELQLAYGNAIGGDPATLVKRMGPQLKEYIASHTHAFTNRNHPWLVEIKDLSTTSEEQPASGPPFYELRINLLLLPQQQEDTRHFYFDYDGVVHQVVNHIIFVAIRNDWETGRSDSLTADSNPLTIRTGNDNKVHPLEINIAKGSWTTGLRNMIGLGMEHIRTGMDHLLFLIVLLLPAMLDPTKRTWGAFTGWKPSIANILKIVTAFTIGHSITLLIGALGWAHIPSQPVEILIAASILVSAAHAIYPIFPGKEIFIAAGFGLIHGLAFSSTISSLNLTSKTLVLSVLGFNIGIECMQLIIIILIIPWLILLSQTRIYPKLRTGAAILSAIAAIGWIVERAALT